MSTGNAEPEADARGAARDGRGVTVGVPCHDEETTIGKVVDDFRRALPKARVVVFDNCCTDRTAEVAAAHGAEVLREPRLGKGYVIERMFDEIVSDYYVLVDGDDTYPAERVHDLLAPVVNGEADMAVGARLGQPGAGAFRRFHVAGNNLVRWLVNRMFGARLGDILSGYRAFNREIVRSTPIVSSGLEVETELTIQVLYNRRSIVEVDVPYRARPEGSESKLHTFRDGARVLWKIFSLFRAIKPLTFFGALGLVLLALGIAAGIAPVRAYLADPRDAVAHLPLAVLATGLVLLAAGSVFLGILLHAVNWRLKELHAVLVRSGRRGPGDGAAP